MFDVTAAAASIEARNGLRAEAKLPRLALADELRRLRAGQEGEAFARVMQSPLRRIVEARLLAKMREERGDPGWTPSGLLSGGGFAFHARLRRIVARLTRYQSS